jgi:hypothetical protein
MQPVQDPRIYEFFNSQDPYNKYDFSRLKLFFHRLPILGIGRDPLLILHVEGFLHWTLPSVFSARLHDNPFGIEGVSSFQVDRPDCPYESMCKISNGFDLVYLPERTEGIVKCIKGPNLALKPGWFDRVSAWKMEVEGFRFPRGFHKLFVVNLCFKTRDYLVGKDHVINGGFYSDGFHIPRPHARL